MIKLTCDPRKLAWKSDMNAEMIETILNAAPGLCVTIIMPVDQDDMRKNIEHAKKNIQTAKALLHTTADELTTTAIKWQLARIESEIEKCTWQSLGLYVCARNAFAVPLPFDVKAKVVVRKEFSVRELLYFRQYLTSYYVLYFDQSGISLFRATANQLQNIDDGNFPEHLNAQYEFYPASAAHHEGETIQKKERPPLSKMKLESVFRDADAQLKKYLTDDSTKIILAGIQRYVNLFAGLTQWQQKLYGKISGVYHHRDNDRLSQAAWQLFFRKRKAALNDALDVAASERNCIIHGFENVWSVVLAGKGETLFVERDFHWRDHPKNYNKSLSPELAGDKEEDPVDILIKMITAKNGKVILTDNNLLKDAAHIALALHP